MRMGIMKKRKQRTEKMEEETRKADLVNGSVKKTKKKGNTQRDRDRKRKQDSRGDGADPMTSRGVNFRNGVLRVNDAFGRNGGGDRSKKRRR